MTRNVVFRARARLELLEARTWYDEQGAGLGDRFVTAVESTIDRIAESPFAFPPVRNERRRALVRRFPYAVYYRVTDDETIVIAVMHTHRDPSRWEGRS